MNDFNLIVSTFRFREEDAADETLDLLDVFGDPDAEAEITDVTGLILARTAMNPIAVVEKLKEVVASEPWEVRYVLRVLPIEKIVAPELEDIQGAAGELAAARIGQDESFRVTVEKRHSHLHSAEIIDYVAEAVKRKVNLENPDWVVLVEIIGKHAGISVVRPGQVFSSVVEKRGP
ncbi:MAG: THUMP domain-containing protein [Nitrososphaera sp.]|uniref:THUMP domain-containing protein n=1 Tax=Nitrososphaera sp. TaxID=1971748 RepID=UPI003D6E11E2